MLRRDLLKSALASGAGALALAQAGAADAGNELETMAVELTKGTLRQRRIGASNSSHPNCL